MDFTVILAILLIVLGAALVVGLIALVAVFVFWRIRKGRAAKAEPAQVARAPASAPPEASAPAADPLPAPPPPPPHAKTAQPSAPPQAMPVIQPGEADEPTTRMPALRQSPEADPSQGAAMGAPKALGFFDDDDYATGSGADAARTELFQRGAQAFDWDDEDDDEGGATEVFSAHHMDELGSDFTIEDEPDK